MITMHTKLCGFYKFEATNIKTGKKRLLADWFPNLITNIGLDRIGTAYDWITYCQVGSGSSAPDFGDTGLSNYIGVTYTSVGTTTGVSGSSPYYRWYKKIYRFNPGDATGNIAEVGVGWVNGSGGLFSRALVLDGAGSPTTITVLSDEYLDVTYECRRYLPEGDVTPYTIELRGVTHTITGGRATYITNTSYWSLPFQGGTADQHSCYVYDGSIGVLTGVPSGASTSTSTNSKLTYTNSNHYRDWKYDFSLTQGNLTNFISAIAVGLVGGWYQFGVSPDIEKTSDDIMSLTFRASWGRK